MAVAARGARGWSEDVRRLVGWDTEEASGGGDAARGRIGAAATARQPPVPGAGETMPGTGHRMCPPCSTSSERCVTPPASCSTAGAAKPEVIDVSGRPTMILHGGDGPPLVYLHSSLGESLRWLPFHQGLGTALRHLCAIASGLRPVGRPGADALHRGHGVPLRRAARPARAGRGGAGRREPGRLDRRRVRRPLARARQEALALGRAGAVGRRGAVARPVPVADGPGQAARAALPRSQGGDGGPWCCPTSRTSRSASPATRP